MFYSCKMKVIMFLILNLFLQVNSERTNILQNSHVETQGTELILSDTTSLPLPNTDVYWTISQTSPNVAFTFTLEDFNIYLVDSIEIQVFSGENGICVQEKEVIIEEYLVRYKVKSETRQIRLSSFPITSNGDFVSVAINSSFPADSIEITRNLSTTGQYCMRYGLIGTEIAQMAVLSYDMSAPIPKSEPEYTGLCNGARCFGGKGRLTDGVRGNFVDIDSTGVGWICVSGGDPCTFIINFIFSSITDIRMIRVTGVSGGMFRNPAITLQTSLNSEPVTFDTERQPVDQDIDQFMRTFPFEFSTDQLVIRMTIPNGNNLVISEVEIINSNEINIATRDIGYTFTGLNQSNQSVFKQSDSITPTEVTESITQNFITNTIAMTSQQPQSVTTGTLQLSTTVLSTSSVTSSPNTTAADDSEQQFISRSDFLTVIGVLVIIILMLVINSIIVIAWLAKSKQTTKKMLKKMQTNRNENENYFYHARRPTDMTVLDISNRYGHDIYDTLNPPQIAYNADNTHNNHRMVHSITNTSQSTDLPLSSLHSSNLGVVQVNEPNYVEINSSAIPTDDIYVEPSVPDFPEIVIEEHADQKYPPNATIGLTLPSIRIQETPKEDDELSVLMVENVAFKPASRMGSSSSMDDDISVLMVENVAFQPLDSASSMDNELGVPMDENVGYISSNLLSPKKPEAGEMKHIYSSIKEGSYFVPATERGNGEFTAYNILKHK